MKKTLIAQEFRHLPESLSGLEELAENLWWSWHPAARMVFKNLDRQAWKESIHNPDKMLKNLPAATLQKAAGDLDYMRHYQYVLSRFRNYMKQRSCPLLASSRESDSLRIAYFSAEYGLHHSLPFYAGGLGFLAGDFIKECSDLNIPLVALGFMYPEGYIHQKISESGWQESENIPLERDMAPITQVTGEDGSPLVIQVPLIDPPIFIGVWKVSVGRIPLYLLDTDIDMNEPWNRSISARLYAGDIEQRLRQEIVLGIGGMEVLEALSINPSLIHLNEGHAAFALLERLRENVNQGIELKDALGIVRRSTVFTTHTPVPAGHDIFPFTMMEKYFHSFWPSLGMDRETFFRLGMNSENHSEGFNMTAFALKLSDHKNGVSKKHGQVANHMWSGLLKKKGKKKIEYITNGVHGPTWIEPKMELLFNKYLGTGWLEDYDNPYLWDLIDEIPDEELWKIHNWLKVKLFDVVRDRARVRWVQDRTHPSTPLASGTFFDTSVLTIGFARRFATYKRADLIFHDIERLQSLLSDRWRPLQIIFAGKAHPNDDPGKLILQRIYNAARNPDFHGRIAFLEDYGEQFAQYMVHGVDVWLNNPLPPMEACGTSGMKAALNGVPNLSILDGWWIEAYNGENGWAFGKKEIEGDRTTTDAGELYSLLENKIVPLYYDTDDEGIPKGWVKVMKSAIKTTAAQFSARRMVKDYVSKFYTGVHQAIK